MKPVAVIYWSAWDGEGEVECFTVGEMNKAIRKLERQNCTFHTCMCSTNTPLPKLNRKNQQDASSDDRKGIVLPLLKENSISHRYKLKTPVQGA